MNASAVACGGIYAIAVIAPFELTRPLLRLPWQSISDVECVLLAAFVAWLLALAWTRTSPRWESPVTWPWLALMSGMGVAALAAGAERANAIHMVCRVGAAFGVFLLTLNGITTPSRLRRVLLAVGAGGVAVSILAVLEYWQVGPVLRVLRLFRPGVAVVGAQVRAGGSLQYPTIASMYLEVVFAFGLGWLAFAIETRRRRVAMATFAALALVAEAIALTYSRAGLIAIAVCLALVALVRYRQRGVDRLVLAVAVLALVTFGTFGLSRSRQSMWLRLTTEGQNGWYRAVVHAPGQLAFTTGEMQTVPIELTNTGRVSWASNGDTPVYLSYHWLEDGFDRIVTFEGLRTPFAEPVPPGSPVTIRARVQAPPWPGVYRLDWDLVQEGRLWFSTEPGAERYVSSATVTGQVFTGRFEARALPPPAFRPGRALLWRTAGRMIAAHPMAGVGPDNYRLLYGRYAGIAHADPRIHSNNMYLEILAGGGLLAALPFAWLLWCAGGLCLDLVRIAADPDRLAALGVVAACLAIALHGLVDSFLSFTPTYVLVAITLGLLATAVPMEPDQDAHRV